MAWSGGVFLRTNGVNSGSGVWAADKAAAVKIRADRHDTHDQDLAEGINACLTKDGTNAATANLNLGGFIYTNAADGTADTHLATKGQTEKKIGRSVTHDFASDADYTLTSTQEGYARIVFTDTGVVLTTGRNVITSTAHSFRWYQNDTAQTLTIKTSAGTGIPVAAGTSRPLVCDGTNVIDPLTSYYTKTQSDALKITGDVVQVVHAQTGAVATGTTTIPSDDTIPQNTEGDQYITQAITPTNASNALLIEAVINLSNSSTGVLAVALFQDATVDALAVSASYQTATAPECIKITYKMAAGTTSSTTFKIRAGSDVAGTTTLNGISGGRKYGGVFMSSLTITEIKA